MKQTDPIEEQSCSFCGKRAPHVRNLISGDSGLICYSCVDACVELMARSNTLEVRSLPRVLPKPAEIKAYLDEYVVGQEYAKRALSVALYNHYKRSRAPSVSGLEHQKSNVLLIGPTGSGKTLLVRTLGKLLDVPFAVVDATGLTEAGYIGADVETAVSTLLQNADYDVERCQEGIIYIDEIDKIARKAASASVTRDVSGEGVQQSLLRLMEGCITRVPKQFTRGQTQHELIPVDTSKILFIFGGAFVGLEESIRSRLKIGALGFGRGEKPPMDPEYLLSQVGVEDLVSFGLIPEFAGRMPVVAVLEPLGAECLVRILTEPRDALIRQYQHLFEMDGVALDFTGEAIRAVADVALELGSGARGLRAVLERALMDAMYEVPSSGDVRRVEVAEGTVLRGESVRLER